MLAIYACMCKYPRGSLRWRHNDHAGVPNHQPHGCLLNRLFRHRSKKTSKLRVTGLCAGNSPGPVNSPHKGPVTRKMFPFDDVIMSKLSSSNVIRRGEVRLSHTVQVCLKSEVSFEHRGRSRSLVSCARNAADFILHALNREASGREAWGFGDYTDLLLWK